MSRRVDNKIVLGIWMIEGGGSEDANGLYAYCVYNSGVNGVIKISHQKPNQYYSIAPIKSDDAENEENQRRERENINDILKEYEIVVVESGAFYRADSGGYRGMPSQNTENKKILYRYKDKKLECIAGETPVPKINFIDNTKLPQPMAEYQTKYKNEYLINRSVPKSVTFSNELTECLKNNITENELPQFIVKIIVDEYILCDHKYSKIGMLRTNDVAKYGADLTYLMLFCNDCHFIWTLPECIGHYGHGYKCIFKIELLKKISFYLGKQHGGRGGYGHRFSMGHNLGWNSFDIVPFKPDETDNIAKFNHGWSGCKTRDSSYFEYVDKLNKRIDAAKDDSQ